MLSAGCSQQLWCVWWWAASGTLPPSPSRQTSNIPLMLSLGRMHLSQGTAVVPLPDVGRLCPRRPLGHLGVWSRACLEVWKAWLCLFALWCGLSSSWQSTLRLATAVGCVLVLGSEICPFPWVGVTWCQTVAMLDKLRAAVQSDALCGRMCDSRLF